MAPKLSETLSKKRFSSSKEKEQKKEAKDEIFLPVFCVGAYKEISTPNPETGIRANHQAPSDFVSSPRKSAVAGKYPRLQKS